MEQVLGMMYGLALGDALGSPVEFWELKGIRERYGPEGITELPAPALFTDDTQMTLAVAEALIDAGAPGPGSHHGGDFPGVCRLAALSGE